MMNVYTRPPRASSSTSAPTPRHFKDSIRWGNSYPSGAPSGSSDSPRVISGEYLAKNRLDARARAKLAADLIEGRAVIGKLTIGQIVILCRSNAIYVADARKSAVATLADATPEELARDLDAAKLWKALELATA
jgi:hypothetical protein